MGKLSDLFLPAEVGTCLFCGERETVVRSKNTVDAGLGIFATDAGNMGGVCDVCSYALRHVWQRARGERIAAVSPRLVRTYALVPRLPEGRLAEDVSAYEFLVTFEGGLPYVELARSPQDLVRHLAAHYGVVTWAEALRSCYLGYSGSTDFSEVLTPWAWGKQVNRAVDSFGRGRRFANFATLLAEPTPDAGFYLGIKAAFEAILWKREVGLAPEGAPYTFMREPAVRYLAHQLRLVPSGESEDDPSMIEVCHGAMSPDELDVAVYLENLRENASRSSAARGPEGQGPEGGKFEADKPASEGSLGVLGDENVMDVSGTSSTDLIDEGFARPRQTLSPPGELKRERDG